LSIIRDWFASRFDYDRAISSLSSASVPKTCWTDVELRHAIVSAISNAFGRDEFWITKTLNAVDFADVQTAADVHEIIAQHLASKNAVSAPLQLPPVGWHPAMVLRWFNAVDGYVGGYHRLGPDHWKMSRRDIRWSDPLEATGSRGLVTYIQARVYFQDGYADSERADLHAYKHHCRKLLRQVVGVIDWSSIDAAIDQRRDCKLRSGDVDLSLRHMAQYPRPDEQATFTLSLTRGRAT
jgi:hypothetical protein